MNAAMMDAYIEVLVMASKGEITREAARRVLDYLLEKSVP